MSRRKQAKPRLCKQTEPIDDNLDNELAVSFQESRGSLIDESGDEDSLKPVKFGTEADLTEESILLVENGKSEQIKEREFNYNSDICLDDELSLDSDTLGTEGGSSWASEDQTASPDSSCATPNSATEGADCELSYTVGVTDGTPHACRFCDKAFPRHSYLKKHEQTHADCMPFRCEYCRRLFKHKRSRDRHIKLHTGDKKYKCTQCEAAFSRSDHLKIHMKTHDNQKPFQCTICNRGYNTAAALTSHMQNHKKSSENAPASTVPTGPTFKCLLCAEVFKKPEDLQDHMNTHPQSEDNSTSHRSSKNSPSSSVRFSCTYCTKNNFTSMDALQSHIQNAHKSILNGDIHQMQKEQLSQHRSNSTSIHSMNSPPNHHRSSSSSNHSSFSPLSSSSSSYFCDLCTMRFSSLHSLQKHLTSIHSSFNVGYNNGFHSHNNNKYNMPPIGVGGPQDLINNGKLYCIYCAMHFLTPASFAEHYIIFHSPYHPQLLQLAAPPEQNKPTDLTINRKSPSKRSTSDDDHQLLSPRKKSRTPNSLSSASSTAQSNSSNTQNNHYDYAGTLLCSQCNAGFSDFESFRAHMKIHIEETNSAGGLLGGSTPHLVESLKQQQQQQPDYVCPHCRSIFKSMEDFSQHVFSHFVSTGLQFGCENCHKSYEKADDLQKHLMDIHSHHLYSCAICNEVFESKVTIQVHFSVTHSVQSKVYRCKVCLSTNAIFRSENEFMAHVRAAHNGDNGLYSTNLNLQNMISQSLRCLICHSVFQSDLELQLHLATHGKQFHCTLCPQSFHIEYLLDKHMQSHQQIIQDGYKNCLDLNSYKNSSNKSSLSEMAALSALSLSSPRNRQDLMKKVAAENNNNHLENCMPPPPPQTYCDICCETRQFSSEMELMAHKKLVHNYNNQNNTSSLGKDCNENRDENKSTGFKHEKSKFEMDGISNSLVHCDICERRDFNNEGELSSHKKLVHHIKATSPGKVSLHCAYCNENCKSRNDLENHMKTHSQNSCTTGKHKCIICDEMCPTAAVLAEHKLTHCKVLSGKTCMQCKGSITNEQEFYSHIQQHNSVANSSNNNNNSLGKDGGGIQHLILPTVCVICRQTLISEMEAKMHARFHLNQSLDNNVPCSVCYQMTDKQDLIAGICRECYQRHGKSSPFRCPECYMNFETGTAIEIHMATVHRKKYQCVKCQVTFESEKEVQHHVATHLMIDGLNGHECRLCRRVLSTPLQLQAHLIEHTFAGCSTFTCYLCSSIFTTAQSLQAHILEHGLSARPYDCPRCNQKFFFASELEHHSYIHLEEMTLNGSEVAADYRYRYQENLSKEQIRGGNQVQNLTTFSNTKIFAKFDDKISKLNGTDYQTKQNSTIFYESEKGETPDDKKDEEEISDGDAEKEIKEEFAESDEEEQIDVVTTKNEHTSK